MSRSLADILNRLDALARYDGPWRGLREETQALQERAAELRERAEHMHDVLVVALVGGSGVGKSTLLNALAGDELARTSPYRPCTRQPAVYAPPGVKLPFEGWEWIYGSALENLVLIDTPDSDSIVREHRDRTIEVLRKCDLILLTATSQKYLDEATWDLVRPLKLERTIACVETKSHPDSEIKAHWLDHLHNEGFTVERYFQVDALKSLDRKLRGDAPGPAELDFPALETFLAEELTRERIERIKRLNVSGLLRKTTAQLELRAAQAEPLLARLGQQLEVAEQSLAKHALTVVEERLFAEPHLWTYAFGREMALRSKGLVGTCARAVEAVRSLPARLGSWLPGINRGASGMGAAKLLANEKLFAEDLEIATSEISGAYRKTESDVALELARAGLDKLEEQDGVKTFEAAVSAQVNAVLRGPAREAVAKRARQLTSWPVTVLSDAIPVALIAFSAYRILGAYFLGAPLPENFISLTAVVLLIVVGAELAVLGALARAAAWAARKEAQLAMRRALQGARFAFPRQRERVAQVLDTIQDIRRLPTEVGAQR